jgi:hypothetical protein
MTFPLAEGTNWNLIVNLEGSDAGSTTAGGRVRYPEYPQGFPYNEVSFQGEGAMQISIHPEYMGPDETGSNEMSVSFHSGSMNPSLSANGPASAVGTFNGKDIYRFSEAYSGYNAHFWLYVNCTRKAANGDVLETVQARLYVGIIKFRHVFISPTWRSFRWMVGGSDLRIKNDGTIELTPIDGETVNVRTSQPVTISPSNPVLARKPLNGGPSDYPSGTAEILLETDLGNFVDGQSYPVIVEANIGNHSPFSVTLRMQYAIVEEWSGTVDRYSMLTGQWEYVGAGGWNLLRGDKLRCTKTLIGQRIDYPWVNFRFASGHSYLIELTPNDFDQSYYATITMGADGSIIKSGVAMTTALSQDFNDARFAAQTFVREYAWSISIGQAVQTGIQAYAPGTGWILTKVGGAVGTFLVNSGLGALGAAPNGNQRSSTNVVKSIPVAAQTAALPTAASSTPAAGSRVMRAYSLTTIAGDTALQSAASSIPPTGNSALSADRVTTVTGDKTIQVNNRNSITTVTSGNRTIVLPPGGQIVGKTTLDGATLGQLTLGGADQFGYGVQNGIVITPATSATSRTPQLTITLNNSNAYRPDTLIVRINGTAVGSIDDRTQSNSSPTFVVQVPESAPLNPGVNHIEAGCLDALFGWTTREAWLVAPGTPPDALSQPPRVLSGIDALILSWPSSQVSGLNGYRLYAGTTTDSLVAITPANTLLPQAIALLKVTDYPEVASARFYAVTVVADGLESAMSPVILAKLGDATGGAPPAVTNVTIAPVQSGLAVNFTSAAGAAGYAVERSIANGTWQPWPYSGAVFIGPFVDDGVTRGIAYAYRIKPFSISLLDGPATTSTTQIATDLPPPAPTGVVAYQRYYGDKLMNVILEWDRPKVQDVTSHGIWVSRSRGPWQRVASIGGDTRQFVYSLPFPDAYVFYVTAIDMAGNESVASGVVGGGLAWPVVPITNILQLLLLD